MQRLPEATIGADEHTPEACAGVLLDGMPQVMWFIRRQMRAHRSHRLSVPQFRTLVLLDRCPTASLSAVAENLGAALPTASRMVSGLVAKRLVDRKACASDRRQNSLVLTGKGRAALNEARRATQAGVAREIARLSDADRGTVARAMKLLQDVFAGTPVPGGDDN